MFVAEIGDKTQLVAFSLTSSTRRPVIIFAASSLALVLSSVIAALLGGAALRVIPGYTRWISSALFIVFGLVILLFREAPKIKEGFFQAALLENAIVRLLPRLLSRISGGKKGGQEAVDPEVRELLREERSHAGAFRLLIREKRLFRDDISDDPELPRLVEELKYPRNLLRLPPEEGLRRILAMEDASIAFFRFLHAHLDGEHHDEPDFQEEIAVLLEEEHHHKAILEALRRELES